MSKPQLITRIRSSDEDGAWIEGFMKGSWQVLYGTETKGDLKLVKQWIRDTAPDQAEDIFEDYEMWCLEECARILDEAETRRAA